MTKLDDELIRNIEQLMEETEREMKKAVNAAAIQGVSFLIMTDDFRLKYVTLDELDVLVEKVKNGRLKSN